MDDPESGKRLLALIERHCGKRKRAQLATAVGIPYAQLGNWVRGKSFSRHNPEQRRWVAQIAAYLGFDESEVWGEYLPPVEPSARERGSLYDAALRALAEVVSSFESTESERAAALDALTAMHRVRKL